MVSYCVSFHRISWWWYGTSFSMWSNSFGYSKRFPVPVPAKTWLRHINFWIPTYLFTLMQSTTNSEIVAPNGDLGDLCWRALLQRLSLYSPWRISFRLKWKGQVGSWNPPKNRRTGNVYHVVISMIFSCLPLKIGEMTTVIFFSLGWNHHLQVHLSKWEQKGRVSST